MKQLYVQCMRERGYEQEWKDDPHIFTRRAGTECYVVLLGSGLSNAENLQKKREWLQHHYEEQGFTRIYHMCILYQRDGMFAPELLNYVDIVPNLWLFAEDQNRMYCFEHQPMEFDGLRQVFEDLPVEKQKQRVRTSFNKQSVPWLTLIIIGINIFCYLFPILIGRYEMWIKAGLDSYELVIKQGQVYRLFTSMFLHGSWNHLFNNMMVLFALGLYLEPALGRIRYCIIYLGSGLAAGLFSAFVHGFFTDSISSAGSIGASGAIFGLTGALLAMVLFWKGKIPGISIRRVVFMCIASLYGGFVSVNVDNAGHIGGLAAGFLFSIITNKFRENYT